MKNNLLKIGLVFVIFGCISLLCSCSIIPKVENTLSREHVKSICSAPNFGTDFTDDKYVILNYVYESKEFAEKYGNTFEVEDIGGTAERGLRFSQIYEGTGKYFVTIDGEDWTFEVSKSLLGKWKVTKCYFGWELK